MRGPTSGKPWGGVAGHNVNGRLPIAITPPKEASAVKRIRAVASRSALVTAALVVALSGCSELSPAVTATPYPASDGASIDLPGSAVALRNFIVIGAEKGAPAVVVGAVINDGPAEVQVSLQADLGATTQPTQTVVRVGAHSSVQIGPEQAFEMPIPELPVEPGANTSFSAATAAGGKAELSVPVLRPEHEYAELTPAPTTAAPTATATKKPKSSSSDDEESSSNDESSSSTDEPTDSPTDN